MNYEEIEGRYINKREKNKKTLELSKKLVNFDETKIKKIEINFNFDIININIENFVQLHYVRQFLKYSLGNWTDKVMGIYSPFGKIATICYRSFDYPEIEINLEVTIENIPKEFLKDGKCKFVETTATFYNFVCENGGKV